MSNIVEQSVIAKFLKQCYPVSHVAKRKMQDGDAKALRYSNNYTRML
jgi:hypothetical protein